MTGVTDVPLAPAVPVAVPLADAAPGGPQGPPGPVGPTGPPGPDAQLIADAKGDLLAAPAPDVLTRVPVGADGQVLTADAATSNGVKWAAAGGSTDLVYNGDFPANTPYTDGDIVIQNGVAYLCVRPTAAAPTPWPGGGSNPLAGIPLPVVNGQWVKGVGGVPVWSAITPADVGLPKITAQAMATGPPAGPVDGDIWIATAVDATSIVWHFRYNAGSASPYKWEYIGGSDTLAYVGTIETTSTLSTWLDLATIGPRFVVPRAGVYDATAAANFYHSSGAGAYAQLAVWRNAAVGPVGVSLASVGGPAGYAQPIIADALGGIVVVAGDDIRVRYLATGPAGVFNFGGRWLRVRPIRIS